MNLINTSSTIQTIKSISNKIKQHDYGCSYCGKGYKLKPALDKHVLLCELIDSSKKRKHSLSRTDDEDDTPTPSNKKLYKMLQELNYRYNKLEKHVEEMKQYVVKKKKQVNIVDWLNNNLTPSYLFQDLSSKIIVTDKIIDFMLHNSFNDTIDELLKHTLYNNTEEQKQSSIPMFAFIQKPNSFYVYDKNKEEEKEKLNVWQELTRENMIRWLNIIQLKISKQFSEWKKKRQEEIHKNDKLCELCDKALVKIMTPQYKEDKYYSKIVSRMYNNMKTDIKVVLEYEFDFE
jgi:hypothetical protein